MSNNSTTRRINIWINGKQVENTFKGVQSALRKARNELSHMTIGSKEYAAQTKKIKKLNGILDEHYAAQGRIRGGWKRFVQEVKQYAVGDIISNMFQTAVQGIKSAFDRMTGQTKKFEEGMTNVFTLLDDPTFEKFEGKLKAGAKEVQSMGFAVNDVTKSLFDTISAGQDAGHSIDFLKQAAVLAKGGVTDLSIATDGMTTIMNAYKLSADEAENVSAAFFSAQKEGKTTVAELSQNIGKAAPLAASLGLEYQELLAATAELTKNGISTGESVTYLRSVMSNLIKPSAEAERILKKFNVPVGMAQVKSAGFTETLERLNQLMKTHPEFISKAIPRVEALTAVQALSGEGLEDYRRILNSVSQDIGENSSLQKAYAKQMESLPNVMAKGREAVNTMAIKLGEKLAPYLKQAIVLFTQMGKKVLLFIDWVVRNARVIKFLAKAVIVVTTALVSYNAAMKAKFYWEKLSSGAMMKLRKLSMLAALAQAKLTGNVKRAAAAQRVLNITMKANPIGLIVSLITTAAAAYFSFAKQAKQATEQTEEFNEAQMATQEILEGQKTIREKHALLSRMSSRQIKKFIDDVEMQKIKMKDFSSELEQDVSHMIEVLKKQGASEEEINKYVDKERAKAIARRTKQLDIEYTSNLKMLDTYISDAKKLLKEKSGDELISPDKIKTPGTGNAENDYIEKQKKIRERIIEMRKAMHLKEMTVEEKALHEVYAKYQEQLEVLNTIISEMETNREQLNNKEVAALNTFYGQKKQLVKMREKELSDISQKYEEKKLEKKKQVKAEIEQILMSDKEKEIHAVTRKYEKLIEKAKKYGIETVELYEKMQEELAAIRNADEEPTDIFGMTEEDWQTFYDHFDVAMQLTDSLKRLWFNYATMRRNQEEKELQQIRKNSEAKKATYQTYLDDKLISERQHRILVENEEKKLARKEAEILREQAEREKRMQKFEAITNMLAGVVKIWGAHGANPILAGVLTAGMLAVSSAKIAAIESQPIPEFAAGGRIDKPTVGLIGEKGSEIVLSNKVLRDPTLGPLADDMARWQEGKNPRILQPGKPNFEGMTAAASNNTFVNSTVQNINIEALDQMSKDMKGMKKAVEDLKYIQAIISDSDLKQNDTDNELRERYLKF